MEGTPIVIICALALVNGGDSAVVRVNSDPGQAPAICAAQGSDSILVAHEDCDKFYKCFQGRPVAINCPGNLLYNPDKEYCDWPENVKCAAQSSDAQENEKQAEASDIASVAASPSVAADICSQDGSDGTLLVHNICSKFYICAEGRPVTLDCPLNLVYNPEMQYCDWPQNVNCLA